jgi:hypothetical protein
MDLNNFATQIYSTGFPLEHRIAMLLRNAGWSVISNKYYIDDLEQTIREVDLVAYRVREVAHLLVYTTLIISCKKSDKNAWVLLSRPISADDPNANLEPFHAWSNDVPISYMISQSNWAAPYYQKARQLGVCGPLDKLSRDIFAFQEMERETGRPHNDKAIFTAVTSLMKAQAYEVNALPERRKEPAVYQFNLLNVVDSDLVCLDFDDTATIATPVKVESELYVTRYIINKQQTFARIQFSTAEHFSQLLPGYKKLHDANCKLFEEAHEAFFGDIVQDPLRWHLLLDKFHARLQWPFHFAQHKGHLNLEKLPVPTFGKSDRGLEIEVDLHYKAVETLNADESFSKATTEALKAIYRYEGNFMFSPEIPF